jgi:hypothetical protein
VAAVAVAALLPSAAHAATCTPSAASRANVIFDGIVLSGPRLGVTADLLSPARVQVVRYAKGHGPRIVRVATSFRQGEMGAAVIGGTFTPEPGEVYRIFGKTPRGASSSTAQGVLEPAACGGFQLLKPGRYLHTIAGTTTRARSTQGGAEWVAQPLSGPDGLLCVRFQPANRSAAVDRQAECASSPGPRALLVGIATTSQGPGTSTAVVVAARTLRGISIESPDGTQRVRGLGSRLPMAVAVFRGFVDPTQLEIHATFTGGKTSEVRLAARRADAPDPGGQGTWAVFGQDAYPHVAGGVCNSWWQPLQRFRDIAGAAFPDEACGTIGSGLWFVVRSVAGPSGRTVVTGAVGPRVRAVTVSAKGTPYPVGVARFGRAFLSVLPAGVSASDMTVTFRMSDGSTRSYAGRAAVGVLHIRKGAL